jgi:hypothetical protein
MHSEPSGRQSSSPVVPSLSPPPSTPESLGDEVSSEQARGTAVDKAVSTKIKSNLRTNPQLDIGVPPFTGILLFYYVFVGLYKTTNSFYK